MSEQQNRLRILRSLAASRTPEELALGYLRYETIRKLSPHQFGALHRLNIYGEKFFDDLVDEIWIDQINPQKPVNQHENI